MSSNISGSRVLGHEETWRLLERTSGLGSHAFLLSGPEHIGKATLVRHLAMKLQCASKDAPCGKCVDCKQVADGVHQDVWWVDRQPGNQDISIAQVRELQQFVSLASLAGRTRVVVVDGAEYLNAESGNALLKVLEEPPKQTLFFLITHEPRTVLPTIRSRCFMLYLSPVPASSITDWLKGRGVRGKESEEVSRLAAGRPGVADALVRDKSELEARRTAAQTFVRIITHGGWPKVQEYLAEAVKGEDAQQERERALWLTEIWLECARDVLLMSLGREELVRYELLHAALPGSVPVLTAFSLVEMVGEARRRLTLNSHVRLTLEWLAYSLGHSS